MRRNLWEWIVRHFPKLLVFYYTMSGRKDSKQMERVLREIEKKKMGENSQAGGGAAKTPLMPEAAANMAKTAFEPVPEKIPPRMDIGHELEKIVDGAISAVMNSDLLIGRNWVMVSGDEKRELLPLLREFTEKNNKFSLIWINVSAQKPRISAAPMFCIPPQLAESDEMDDNYAELVAIETERYFSAILDFLPPKLLIVWNELASYNRIFANLAKERDIPTIFAGEGELPGTLVLDAPGETGEDPSARHPLWPDLLPVGKKDLELAKNIAKHLRACGKSRAAPKIDDISANWDINRPTVFYAGPDDANSGISPILSLSHEAMLHLAELAEKNKWNFICVNVKFGADAYVPPNAALIKADFANEIIDLADVAVTMFSKISYAALVREKPVVVLGYTQLRGQGCAYEAFEAEKIEAAIFEALQNGLTEGQKAAFAEHIAKMCKHYLFDGLREREIRYGKPAGESVKYLESAIGKTAGC